MLILHNEYEIRMLADGCEPNSPRYKRFEAVEKRLGELYAAERQKPKSKQDYAALEELLFDDQGNAYRIYGVL